MLNGIRDCSTALRLELHHLRCAPSISGGGRAVCQRLLHERLGPWGGLSSQVTVKVSINGVKERFACSSSFSKLIVLQDRIVKSEALECFRAVL